MQHSFQETVNFQKMIRTHQTMTHFGLNLNYDDAVTQLTCHLESYPCWEEFSKNLHSCPCRTSFDPTRFQQTIVMAHQKVTFNLLQCIENYSDKNQQRGSSKEVRKL